MSKELKASGLFDLIDAEDEDIKPPYDPNHHACSIDVGGVTSQGAIVECWWDFTNKIWHVRDHHRRQPEIKYWLRFKEINLE